MTPNAKQNLTIGGIIAGFILALPSQIQQTVFSAIATPVLALVALLTSIFGPHGWIISLYNWVFGTAATPGAITRASRRAIRTLRMIGYGLIGLVAAMALAIRFDQFWFVALVLTILGLLSCVLFRATTLIPGATFGGLAGRATDALRTMTVTLFFLALLALAAGEDVLPTLTFASWLMLALLCLIIGSTVTTISKGGVWGRRIMVLTSAVLVAAVILPQLFGTGPSPVLTAGKEVVIAVRDRSVSQFYNWARGIEPETPARIDQIGRDFRKTVRDNDANAYENDANAVLSSGTVTNDQIEVLIEKKDENQRREERLGILDGNVTVSDDRKAAPCMADELITIGKVVSDFLVHERSGKPKTGTDGKPIFLHPGNEFRTLRARPAPISIGGDAYYEAVLPNDYGSYIGQTEIVLVPVRHVQLDPKSVSACTDAPETPSITAAVAGWVDYDRNDPLTMLAIRLFAIVATITIVIFIWKRWERRRSHVSAS